MKLVLFLGSCLALVGVLAGRSPSAPPTNTDNIIDVAKKNSTNDNWELAEPLHETKMVLYGRIFCAELQEVKLPNKTRVKRFTSLDELYSAHGYAESKAVPSTRNDDEEYGEPGYGGGGEHQKYGSGESGEGHYGSYYPSPPIYSPSQPWESQYHPEVVHQGPVEGSLPQPQWQMGPQVNWNAPGGVPSQQQIWAPPQPVMNQQASQVNSQPAMEEEALGKPQGWESSHQAQQQPPQQPWANVPPPPQQQPSPQMQQPWSNGPAVSQVQPMPQPVQEQQQPMSWSDTPAHTPQQQGPSQPPQEEEAQPVPSAAAQEQPWGSGPPPPPHSQPTMVNQPQPQASPSGPSILSHTTETEKVELESSKGKENGWDIDTFIGKGAGASRAEQQAQEANTEETETENEEENSDDQASPKWAEPIKDTKRRLRRSSILLEHPVVKKTFELVPAQSAVVTVYQPKSVGFARINEPIARVETDKDGYFRVEITVVDDYAFSHHLTYFSVANQCPHPGQKKLEKDCYYVSYLPIITDYNTVGEQFDIPKVVVLGVDDQNRTSTQCPLDVKAPNFLEK